jgi:hypothetical protein
MKMRPATPDDRDAMFDVWLGSVRATHAFVSEADIHSFMPLGGFVVEGRSERDEIGAGRTRCFICGSPRPQNKGRVAVG